MLDTGWAQLDKDPEYSRVYPIGNMRVSSVPWRAARAGFRYSQNGTLWNFGATVARLIRP
jgi:hypothetical protein